MKETQFPVRARRARGLLLAALALSAPAAANAEQPTVAPVETFAPGEMLAPMETVAPVETFAPMETLMPVETLAPMETIAPAETLAPQFVPQPGKDYAVLSGIPQTDHPLGLPETARADDSYFDRAVFVGDSVSLKLRNYVMQRRKSEPKFLSNAQFLAVGSFSAKLALERVSANSAHPKYKGKKMAVEDILAKSKASKAFIMLGMNDIGPSGVEGAVRDMMTLLDRIRRKNPGIEIYVQSATPRLSGGPPSTQGLFEYDLALYDAVLARGDPKMHFVDVAYVMRDSEGKLFPEYCSDPEDLALHFTNEACQKWIDFLLTHASA